MGQIYGISLHHHIHHCPVGTGVLAAVHLSKIECKAYQEVASNNVPVTVLNIVAFHTAGKVGGLVEDIIHLYTKSECLYSFIGLNVPIESRLPVTVGIAAVKAVVHITYKTELFH